MYDIMGIISIANYNDSDRFCRRYQIQLYSSVLYTVLYTVAYSILYCIQYCTVYSIQYTVLYCIQYSTVFTQNKGLSLIIEEILLRIQRIIVLYIIYYITYYIIYCIIMDILFIFYGANIRVETVSLQLQ